jgi:hypothetical protein
MTTYSLCLFETLFRVGFKIPYPLPFFARRDYKPIDKEWAMVLGTAPKTTCNHERNGRCRRINGEFVVIYCILIKNIKFSSYIRKFRMEQLQSHI